MSTIPPSGPDVGYQNWDTRSSPTGINPINIALLGKGGFRNSIDCFCILLKEFQTLLIVAAFIQFYLVTFYSKVEILRSCGGGIWSSLVIINAG